MNDAVKAWSLSRDPQADYAVDMIAAVDAPVMEMPTALLNFENFTIIEREIFCSLRNHVVWARTSRVDDPMLFTVPEDFKSKRHEMYRRSMALSVDQKIAQDQWRLFLPLVAHTNWTQRMSLRDMARMAVYFNTLMGKVPYKLGKRFGDVSYKLIKCICGMIGGKVAKALLEKQPVIHFLYEGRMPSNSSVTKLENFTIVNAIVNVGLRAQIVRHRELQFVDDFLNMINTEEFNLLQLQHVVRMQLMARKDIWQAVLSKRACWIAQADLWQPIIKAFGNEPPLPCAGGECPFEVDARARLVPDKDPNPPCPVFCNLYGIPKESYRDTMMKEAKLRGPYWEEQVNV